MTMRNICGIAWYNVIWAEITQTYFRVFGIQHENPLRAYNCALLVQSSLSIDFSFSTELCSRNPAHFIYARQQDDFDKKKSNENLIKINTILIELANCDWTSPAAMKRSVWSEKNQSSIWHQTTKKKSIFFSMSMVYSSYICI